MFQFLFPGTHDVYAYIQAL